MISLVISVTSHIAIKLNFRWIVYQKHVTNTGKFVVLHVVVIHKFSYPLVYTWPDHLIPGLIFFPGNYNT